MTTMAQEVYERVEALVASGVRKADAFRQVAEQDGKPFNSMRGAYYTHTRTLGLPTSSPGNRQKAASDPVEAATIVLEKAIVAIDNEVAAAKTRLEQANGQHEQLRDTAKERKLALQAKIEALKA